MDNKTDKTYEKITTIIIDLPCIMAVYESFDLFKIHVSYKVHYKVDTDEIPLDFGEQKHI